MRTYENWLQELQETEGFQGKFTPDNDARRNAIEVGNKVSPKRTIKRGSTIKEGIITFNHQRGVISILNY